MPLLQSMFDSAKKAAGYTAQDAALKSWGTDQSVQVETVGFIPPDEAVGNTLVYPSVYNTDVYKAGQVRSDGANPLIATFVDTGRTGAVTSNMKGAVPTSLGNTSGVGELLFPFIFKKTAVADSDVKLSEWDKLQNRVRFEQQRQVDESAVARQFVSEFGSETMKNIQKLPQQGKEVAQGLFSSAIVPIALAIGVGFFLLKGK